MALKSNEELGLESHRVKGKTGRMVEGGMFLLGPKRPRAKIKSVKKRKNFKKK